MWDWDFNSAPALLDIMVDGRATKAVAQVSKQNFVYVFDRVTGAPVCPIEERPVPQGNVPGGTTGAPMTYLLHGTQYIVVAVGWKDLRAEWVALSLL